MESLSESLDLVEEIIQERGEQISSLKEIAIATGIGEGTLPLPLSTACQYGILISGAGYRPTALYHAIKSPTFEYEKAMAIHEALSNPPLYKRIIEEFNGKQLPSESGFTNYLSKTHGFKAYAIPKIVRAFFENFRPSIDANNKLRFLAPQKKDGNMETLIQDVEPVAEQKLLSAQPMERTGNFQTPIPLTEDKMIILEYPKGNMTVDDFTALKAYIAYLELTEGKKKENE